MRQPETIEQKRRRIANRKRELAGLPRLALAPAKPSPERSACGRPVRRKGPQRSKASPLPELERWDLERLWSHVERCEPNECWPWTAAKSGFGYGRFKVAGKLYSPHRLIYALEHGPIVNAQERHGSVVMHGCDNPACCNPGHLSLGRQVENVADMIAKGRRGRTGPPPHSGRLGPESPEKSPEAVARAFSARPLPCAGRA